MGLALAGLDVELRRFGTGRDPMECSLSDFDPLTRGPKPQCATRPLPQTYALIHKAIELKSKGHQLYMISVILNVALDEICEWEADGRLKVGKE